MSKGKERGEFVFGKISAQTQTLIIHIFSNSKRYSWCKSKFDSGTSIINKLCRNLSIFWHQMLD